MGLYHLDPRQAGTGAAPDVDVRFTDDGDEGAGWFYRPTCAGLPGRTDAYFDTEAAALAAARQAAGFGHVAERACDGFVRAPRASDPSDLDDCATCAWPRDAHRE